MFSILVDCDSCGSKGVEVSQGKVKRHKCVLKDGESIWVTYYDCPNCGKKHVVQADSKETLQILQEETKLAMKVLRAKKFGKSPHRKQAERYRKMEKDLASSRKALMAKFSGATVVDVETNEELVLEFETEHNVKLNV